MTGKSMTTDVSMSPRGGRGSATGRRIMIDQGVQVFPKTSERDAWRAGESGQSSLGLYKHPLSHGNQLADGHAIACDDECFPLVQGPHDAPALVAELSLRDRSTHRRPL